MRKITIKKLSISNWDQLIETMQGQYFALTEYKDKKYQLTRCPTTCRGYLGQSLVKRKNNNIPKMSVYSLPNNFKYDSGYTYLTVIFTRNPEKEKTFLSEESLAWLHAYEDQAGVRRSEIVKCDIPNMYTLISSKYWKDSCWKIMIFSYLVKCMAYKDPYTCDPQYWKSLNTKNPKTNISNIDQYLSQIKMPHTAEIFDSKVYDYPGNPWYNSHNPNGFYHISTGINEPMRELLGITKYVPS